jgi:hypothetical protein
MKAGESSYKYFGDATRGQTAFSLLLLLESGIELKKNI